MGDHVCAGFEPVLRYVIGWIEARRGLPPGSGPAQPVSQCGRSVNPVGDDLSQLADLWWLPGNEDYSAELHG
ncbi:hypothetical protein ACGFNU_37040 [Spirillospora sp. NPDC048911]|uniref:hypothetical protein n=1 Tax=Spirillospora sp. NPDC048911 TaxID=3364527 RepID=UPI0037155474